MLSLLQGSKSFKGNNTVNSCQEKPRVGSTSQKRLETAELDQLKNVFLWRLNTALCLL